jgi:hypothetical protein
MYHHYLLERKEGERKGENPFPICALTVLISIQRQVSKTSAA